MSAQYRIKKEWKFSRANQIFLTMDEALTVLEARA